MINVKDLLEDYYSISTINKEMEEIKSMRLNVENDNVDSLILLKRCVKNKHFGFLHLKKEDKETFVTHIARKLQEGGILLTTYRNFEQLYGAVEKLIGSEKGIGDLMLYDIARMIGYSMQPTVLPVKLVYLQSGAKTGAKTLLGLKRVGRTLPTSAFYNYFPTEDSQHIEDILCIYKKDFEDVFFVAKTIVGCGKTRIKYPNNRRCK